MVTLRHTPSLEVSHDRLSVTSVSGQTTHNGEAVTVQLALIGLIIGLIDNDGNGGLTELPTPSDLFGGQRLLVYIGQRRIRTGYAWLALPDPQVRPNSKRW